jgi:hypothetical protein
MPGIKYLWPSRIKSFMDGILFKATTNITENKKGHGAELLLNLMTCYMAEECYLTNTAVFAVFFLVMKYMMVKVGMKSKPGRISSRKLNIPPSIPLVPPKLL